MKPTTIHGARQVECGTSTGDVVTITATGDRGARSTLDASTERSRRIWGAGAYDRIAAGFRHEAEAFVGRRALSVAHTVLDAACGSGNLTIPAARTGATVIGLDLAPSLLDSASAWADREQLRIELREGNVEELPFEDAQFDVVLSMFGVMFAARPDRVVAELARVTKRGGQVALANWTRTGFVGQMLAMHVAAVAPPAGASSPLLWGDDSFLRAHFDERTWHVEATTRMLTFHFPYSPAGTAELFRSSYGPTVRTFEALDEDQRADLAEQLRAHWVAHHRSGPAATTVSSEYLEVVATRR